MMPPSDEYESLLSRFFLNVDVSDLDRERCALFLKRAGWEALCALGTSDQIRTHLSISRAPAIKLEAAVALCEQSTKATRDAEWTLEQVCEDLKHLPHEELRGIYWGSNNNILHAQTLAVGTVDTVELSPYAALRPAFLTGSRRITLAHNHPSQVLHNSISDIAAMSRLSKIASSVGIEIDPLVVIACAD